MLKNIVLGAILLCLAIPVQGGDGKYEWRIVKQGGEAVENASLTILQNDTLFFFHARNFADYVTLDSIVHISRKRGDAALAGLLIGGAAGGLAGYAVKPATRNESETQIYSTLFGLVVGSGIGFLAGSQFSSTQYYDLSRSDLSAKRKIIGTILE